MAERDERGISGWLRLTWRQAQRVRLPELNDYCVTHVDQWTERGTTKDVGRARVERETVRKMQYYAGALGKSAN